MLRFIIFLLIAGPVFAESLFDNQLQFTLPSGFRRMTSQEIGLKYPAVNPPQFVYTNEGLTCSLAFTHSTSKLVPADLAKFKDFMEATLKRQQPGLVWETSEVMQLGGVDWMHFVFVSQALDQKVRNEMLGAPFQGRALLVNLNCTVKDYPGYKKDLDRCRDSFRVR